MACRRRRESGRGFDRQQLAGLVGPWTRALQASNKRCFGRLDSAGRASGAFVAGSVSAIGRWSAFPRSRPPPPRRRIGRQCSKQQRCQLHRYPGCSAALLPCYSVVLLCWQRLLATRCLALMLALRLQHSGGNATHAIHSVAHLQTLPCLRHASCRPGVPRPRRWPPQRKRSSRRWTAGAGALCPAKQTGAGGDVVPTARTTSTNGRCDRVLGGSPFSMRTLFPGHDDERPVAFMPRAPPALQSEGPASVIAVSGAHPWAGEGGGGEAGRPLLPKESHA